MSLSSQNTLMNLPGKMSSSFIFSLTLLAPSLNVHTAKTTSVLTIFRLFVCLGWIFPYNTIHRFISVLSAALKTFVQQLSFGEILDDRLDGFHSCLWQVSCMSLVI